MRNSKVIREEIGEVKTALDALENLVSEENRDFSEDEKVSFDTNMERLSKLVDELPKVEKEEEGDDMIGNCINLVASSSK